MKRTTLAGLAVVATVALGQLPAQAGWKDEVGTLRIGMLARPGAGAAVPGASAIERAFSQALGIPVDIFVARDFAALIDAQASARVHYAVYSALAYALAWRRCGCVEPLVAPISRDGATGIRSLLVVAPGVEKQGAPPRIAFVSGNLASDFLPRLSPKTEAGKDVSAREKRVAVETAADAERRFADGEVDGLFGWAYERVGGATGGTVDRLVEAGLDADDFDIAWTSAPIRYGPHAIRADVPGELKQAITRFLAGLKLQQPDVYDLLEEERQGGYLRVSHSDYESVLRLTELFAPSRPGAPSSGALAGP
ncbi:phosphate/phosphite/phosphonate ABC transporter substrate-binding protein [Nitratireductor arenosus]|nr:PhnD/SsuA/transferrin family substrate-binding protein [Nitratireductor arenosus]